MSFRNHLSLLAFYYVTQWTGIPGNTFADAKFLSNQTRKEPSAVEAVKFLRKFGYIQGGDNTSDFIFSSETFREKLKQVQEFGNIPQTGELLVDEDTVALMASRRCGVHDIFPDRGTRRWKRFITGSSAWNKRNITYNIANWSSKLKSHEEVRKKIIKAFQVWSQYSYLTFQEVASDEADIVIFFAQYSHYDNYPFDGEGGILAHAFYPYEFGSKGGDIHFDDSEDWALDPAKDDSGLDFFAVAVHEIGHSLGLAHSPVSSSVMFPYYKAPSSHFSLDYDDVMGMWQLYIQRRLEGDDEYFKGATTPSSTTTAPTERKRNDEREGNGDEKKEEDYDYDIRYHGDYETVEEHQDHQSDNADFPNFGTEEREDERRVEQEQKRKWNEREETDKRRLEEKRRAEEEILKREYEERRKLLEDGEDGRRKLESGGTTTIASSVPDICKGNLDSIAAIRGELFIFKGQYMWRYLKKGRLVPGYPSSIQDLFSGLPSWISKVDAVYERRNDSTIVFFVGTQIFVHDGVTVIAGSPLPLTHLGLPELDSIDAVMFWPKNQRTYLFKRNVYWRRDDFENRMDDGYPKEMATWNGIPNDIDGSLTDSQGTTYFFRDSRVWQYDNTQIRPTPDSPSYSIDIWTGC